MAFCFSKAQCRTGTIILPREQTAPFKQAHPERLRQLQLELKHTGDAVDQWSGFPPGNWSVEVD